MIFRSIFILKVVAALYILHAAQFSKADLEEPLILLQGDPSFFGSSEISLGTGAIVRFSRQQPIFGSNSTVKVLDEIRTSISNDNVNIRLNCTLSKREGVVSSATLNDVDLIKSAMIQAYDIGKVVDLLRQLEGCQTFASDTVPLVLCLNSHARLRILEAGDNEQKEIVLGIFGSSTEHLVSKKSTLIHVVSESGVGTSHIKQVWKNGNICDSSGTLGSITVYMSCNPSWGGIYGLTKVSSCDYIAYVYVSKLCNLKIFQDFNHSADDLERARNVIHCSLYDNGAVTYESKESNAEDAGTNPGKKNDNTFSTIVGKSIEPISLKDIVMSMYGTPANVKDTLGDLVTSLTPLQTP